jgi:ABC-type bacteriocin/lantibiotic exporter with double-glycine peptidase domain
MVFWLGGHFVLREAFTIGTLVAFRLPDPAVWALMALTNARVDFATPW